MSEISSRLPPRAPRDIVVRMNTAKLTARSLVLFALMTASAREARADEDIDTLTKQALAASQASQLDKAIELWGKVIAADPKRVDSYRSRGRDLFRANKITECIADFDQFAKLAPDRERELWERGIAYYYAGKFEAGAKQFAQYQEYHDADVENSAWRYLCMARTTGVEKARAALFDIKGERRVPLNEVLALYAGKGSVDDVLKAAAAGDPPTGERELRQFFADLYLGMYYEAAGDAERARKHFTAAAENHRAGGYMGDVARVHVARLPKK
jgi:lipoprotein NlpI